MKKCAILLGLVFSLSNLVHADQVIKASELPEPPKAAPSKQAQKKAHQRVEKRKEILKEKLEEGASAQEIGKAKAQLQVDRVEANRQDYLNDEQPKDKTESKTSTTK